MARCARLQPEAAGGTGKPPLPRGHGPPDFGDTALPRNTAESVCHWCPLQVPLWLSSKPLTQNALLFILRKPFQSFKKTFIFFFSVSL